MTPATAAALRCAVCAGPLSLHASAASARILRCPAGHSFDLAKEGYAHLLPLQKKHAAEPGDNKAMVRARHSFLQAGHYAALMQPLADLCAALPHARIVDAGCGEGCYDQFLAAALPDGASVSLAGFDLSKEAVRLAARALPNAAYCVGSSFCAPIRDGWADLVLNIFSPMAAAEFARMLRVGGHLIYAVPTARHLFGLKQVLYEKPYENEVKTTEYPGFALEQEVVAEEKITLTGEDLQNLFAMTPYYWKTSADGAARLAECERLTTEIGFRYLVYRKE